MDSFGERLKSIRLKSGLTQVKMAVDLGFHEKQISRWERGVNFPSVETLYMLADYFCIDPGELVSNTIAYSK